LSAPESERSGIQEALRLLPVVLWRNSDKLHAHDQVGCLIERSCGKLRTPTSRCVLGNVLTAVLPAIAHAVYLFCCSGLDTMGARLVTADAEAARRAEEDPLSDREGEVLRLLALGHTNQEIAKQLYISVRTVETHRAHIMRKLRFQSRGELVRYAIERGLLDDAPA
jgi:DNA-binding CsgD family transcriptional regulator